MWRAALLLLLTAAFFVELDEFLADSQEAGGAARKAYATHGPVRKKDLARWLAFLEIPMKGAEDLSKTFEEFDEDGDGSISFAEMVTEMKTRFEDERFLNSDKVQNNPETTSPVQVDTETQTKILKLLSHGGNNDVRDLVNLIQMSSNHKKAVFNAAVFVASNPPHIKSLPKEQSLRSRARFIVAETPRGGTSDDVGKIFVVTKCNKARTSCQSVHVNDNHKLTVDFKLDKCYNPSVTSNAMDLLGHMVLSEDDTHVEPRVWVSPVVQLLETSYKARNIAWNVHWHVLGFLDKVSTTSSAWTDLNKNAAIDALKKILEVYKAEGYEAHYAEDVVDPAQDLLNKLIAPAED